MAEETQDLIEQLLPAYALNALEPEEFTLVEQALAREPRYRESLAAYLAAAADLSAAFQPAIPSAALRDRVLGRVSADAALARDDDFPAAQRASIPRVFWGAAAAFLIAATGLGGLALIQQQRVGDLEQGMAEMVVEAEETENKLQEQIELTALAVQPGVSRASIQPVEPPPPPANEPMVMLFTDPNGKRVLMTMGLPVLPGGSTYQAWLWEGDRVHSVGLFDVDDSGYALVPMWIAPESNLPRQLWISVEQEGGAIVPTKPLLWGGIDSMAPDP